MPYTDENGEEKETTLERAIRESRYTDEQGNIHGAFPDPFGGMVHYWVFTPDPDNPSTNRTPFRLYTGTLVCSCGETRKMTQLRGEEKDD